uniref:Uncharacterized protein n=1 Tax=viral metagenome TaxID=1070528 RepID=A0A6C0ATF8_9ZZZZ
MFKLPKLGFLKKFHYNFNPILQNRFVLYFFFLLAFIELLYFLNMRDGASTMVLLLVGFLTTFFSKNMIVVICISLVVTNLIRFGIKQTMEGFDGKESTDETVTDGSSESKHESAEPKNDETKKDKPKKAEPKKAEPTHVNNDNTDSSKKKEIAESYENLQKEYPQFKVVQQEILDGVQKMAPLLDKAERFIDKFDKYKKSKMSN